MGTASAERTAPAAVALTSLGRQDVLKRSGAAAVGDLAEWRRRATKPERKAGSQGGLVADFSSSDDEWSDMDMM